MKRTKAKTNEIKVRVLTLGISKKSRKRLCKSDRKMINEIIRTGGYYIKY